MKKKIIQKKALVMQTVVALIVLILGFAILLFAFYQLNWTGNVDKKVCSQSVVYRATLPSFANSKELVPLKCKTGKICITSGNGKCKEFENTKGVTTVKAKDVEDVEQTVAKEILSCWEMMGEGKLSLFSNGFMTDTYGFGTITSSCVICSRIAFDKEGLKKSGIDLNKMSVYDYMISHKVPNKDVSYYVYMSGKDGRMSIKDVRGIVQIDDVGVLNDKENIEKVEVNIEESSGIAPGEELSVMFMQVSAPKYKNVFMNSLGTLFGTAALGRFAIAPKFTKIVMKSPWTYAVLAIAGVYQYSSVSRNQALTAGYCGDVSIGEDSTSGCSVVRTVNYGAEDLSQYCSKVESIP